MYLLIWNGTVHSYGDAGKKDGIVHAVVTGVTDSSRRKYAGVEPEFEGHLRLWRRDPDHEPGNDKHTDTLKLRK